MAPRCLGSACVTLKSQCVWADTLLRGLICYHDACNLAPQVALATADCGRRGSSTTGGGDSAVVVPQFSESTVGCGSQQRPQQLSTGKQIGGFSLPHERSTGLGMFLTNDRKRDRNAGMLILLFKFSS